jgi:hypothetical protein
MRGITYGYERLVGKMKTSVIGTIVKMDDVISLYIKVSGWEGV